MGQNDAQQLHNRFLVNGVQVIVNTVFLHQEAEGLFVFVRPFWCAYLQRGLSAGGAFVICKKTFSEKMIQDSQFASLNNDSNIICNNNLNDN